MSDKRDLLTSDPVLIHDIRQLIKEARESVATVINAGMTMLYWQIGNRINKEILKGNRADYGERIVHSLSAQLHLEYGQGFTKRNLFNMIRFAQIFPEQGIVNALRTQLN